MGYALFAVMKQVADCELNSVQIQQNQRSREQFELATSQSGLKQQLSSLESSKATDAAADYKDLAETTNSEQRDAINADIKRKEQEYKVEENEIQRQIDDLAIRENIIQMEIKRLDTVVTAKQKQLDAIEQAEGSAIDRATPKFAGVG